MSLHRHCLALVLVAVISNGIFAQQPFGLNDTLRLDPKITMGKFANGLTFYIRTNKKPENRAELRLIVRAGSVLEDDDQQGLAHFVEHLAFDGTRSFPKNELISLLEKEGVKMGPDINAYTSFDETVYMLQIPTDSAALLTKAFQILKEWASAVTFDDAEIDRERGVVIEEWRLGRGANERVQNKHYPFIFYKSQYAKRLPIGKKEVLDTCSHEAIKRFYRDWYRPNLMAVVAVGDFNPDSVKFLIQNNFAPLQNPISPRVRPEYNVPDHQETLVSVATDAELPYTTASVSFKRDVERELTVGDYRRDITGEFYDAMLNARIQERLLQPNPPFISGSTGDSPLLGKKQSYSLYARVKEDQILGGLQAMLSEVFQARDHGFTTTELERVKKSMMRGMEEAYLERDKTESAVYVNEIIRNFLQDEPMPGIESEHAMVQQLIPTITLGEVNSLSSVRITQTNRVATLSVPKKEGVAVPNESEILGVLKSAENQKTEAYVDKVNSENLYRHCQNRVPLSANERSIRLE